MPATTRTPLSRPPGAPAYYLARPAIWWLTAFSPPAGPQRPAHRGTLRPGRSLR